MITQISHMTFIVTDLERSAAFFEAALDAREVYSSGEETFSLSREKFFLIGGLWVCLMEGQPHQSRTYDHIAFHVEEEEFDACVERLQRAGAEVLPGRPRVSGEGRSAYFYDPDNHLFELHTGTLQQRLARYEQGC